MKTRFTLSVLIGLITLMVSDTHAANGELLGGWEGDTRSQGYGFVAVGKSRQLSPRTSLIVRASVSYLYYEYDHDDSTTKVTSPGASLQAGLNYSSGKVTVSLVVGPEIRWNDDRTHPAGGSSTVSVHDRIVSGVVQGYLNASMSPKVWVTLLANYNGGNKYMFNRLSLERRFGASMTSVGLEGTAQGNADVKSFQFGPFVGIPNILPRVSLRLSGGYKDSWNADHVHNQAGYVGASFYTRL